MRGLLMAQLRHGDFSQELCVQKADCQLAAKGGANAAIEISFQDRSKSAERSRDRSHTFVTRRYRSGLLNFAVHSPEDSNATKIPFCAPRTDRIEGLFQYITAEVCAQGAGNLVTERNRLHFVSAAIATY